MCNFWETKSHPMKRIIFEGTFAIFLFVALGNISYSQTNMFISNPLAEEILLGNYQADQYVAKLVIDSKIEIMETISNDVSRENLLELLEFLDTFHNRNTGSDTLSLTTGIGACRTWIKSYFDLISKENDNRLITGYLEFDANVCGMGHHKNPFAILPGKDTSLHEILVIEGHFDTRNSDGCDTQGYTPGSDDNGSGTVLVMETARIMAKYTFDRTILFTTTTGEDQGLWGAKAWASYLSENNIDVMACLNNDVVGGIFCGKTSSPPSCPYYGHVDSTHVRVFSYVQSNSTYSNSPHKQLARLIKIIQEEEVNPYLKTPMTVNIMATEDRSGRSGDHIPFRQKGFPSIRFCSANEHGNGRGTYPDRQHSTRDVLGIDSNDDGQWDTLYVDPSYLRRNTFINAATLANLANSTPEQEYSFTPITSGVRIDIENPDSEIDGYRVGIRYRLSRSHNFDEIKYYNSSDAINVILEPGSRSYISIAAIKDGFTGKFSSEYALSLTGNEILPYSNEISNVDFFPNPANDILKIVISSDGYLSDTPRVNVYDLMGRKLLTQEIQIISGNKNISEVDISSLDAGIYMVGLELNGIRFKSHRLIKTESK